MNYPSWEFPVRHRLLTSKSISVFWLFVFISSLPNPSIAQNDTLNNWAYKMMSVPANAPDFFTPGRTITIAIIDDGFDLQQPLWKNHLYHNPKEIALNGMDDDGNGLTDDATGWDFAGNDADVNPPVQNAGQLSHGTAVAGICWQMLQKLTGNGIKHFQLLPIKAMADAGLNNYISQGYKGIEYALAQGAQVILCCWSGGEYGQLEEAIINQAINKGVLVIGAAGNFESMKPQYPGACLPVINVTAVNSLYKKSGFANYGSFVDLAAPSDSIFTLFPYEYLSGRYLSGTSAAAPWVAATVAALLATDASLKLFDIDRLLKNTATPVDEENPLYAGNLGAGLLNIGALIIDWKSIAKIRTQKSQPEGYIPLSALREKEPFLLNPKGNFPSIRFFIKYPNAPGSSSKWPALKFACYHKGILSDTMINGHSLSIPFSLTADSIQIFMAAKKAKNINEWLYYKAITIDSSTLYCSGTKQLTALSGDIEDGSGPADYANRCDCKWMIKVPAGKKIHISFNNLDTEAKVDYVYIFNGTKTNDPILAMFSGNKIPPEFTSWGNELLIWFSTNEFNHYKGWKLHYETVE